MANEDQQTYDTTDTAAPTPEGVEEEREFVPDPTAMSGTLDTSGVGSGPHDDVREVSSVFAEAEERLTNTVETSNLAGDDPEAQQRQVDAQAEADAQRSASQQEAHDLRVQAGLAASDTQTEGGTPTEGYGAAEGQPEGPQEADEDLPEEYGTFDPNEDGKTVPVVNDYLASLPDDERGEAEHERVLNLERQGKKRDGILGE